MLARVVWDTVKKHIFKFNMFFLNFLPYLGCLVKEVDFIILTFSVFYISVKIIFLLL